MPRSVPRDAHVDIAAHLLAVGRRRRNAVFGLALRQGAFKISERIYGQYQIGKETHSSNGTSL